MRITVADLAAGLFFLSIIATSDAIEQGENRV